ncbi:hypothetical protein CTEN210_05246 [Chaetoceros tenuissimus]|uniref:Glucosidase II beta subunit N-terminal domain-containing protein n=1 Tax=Chaetoceros tenuissimus TaxID=426638 RepID=A0AAD3H395_9STRA|nr:hypothetical protein CTEN210_05246 [Chaetoceros tenuissimus]
MSQHQGKLRQRTKNNVQSNDFAKDSFNENFLPPDQSPLLRTRDRRRRRRTRDAKDVYMSYILVFCTTSIFVFLFLHWPRSNAAGRHLFQHAYHTEMGSTYHKKLRQMIHVKGQSKGEKIICKDGSTGIINDDFCDCPDGADELESAACSHILVQKRLFDCGDGTKIFLSRVKDGVLDCSNGADEVKS